MRRLCFSLTCLTCSLLLMAVPAKRTRRLLKLSDGTTVEATAQGDEHLHFFRTSDGRCLMEDSTGIARYAQEDSLTQVWHQRAQRRHDAKSKSPSTSTRHNASAIADTPLLSGIRRTLVLLVQLADVHLCYEANELRDMLAKEGHHDAVNSGSVRDYFLSQSYGQLDLQLDVVGPVTLSHPMEYYGANNALGYDGRAAELVAEAFQQTDETMDLSAYDWDGDGAMEHLIVIHAGHDEAQGAPAGNIWSHQWTLSEAQEEMDDGQGPIVRSGITVDSYILCAELGDKSGTAIAGIGTICHELSHCFGLMDVYNTSANETIMDVWDLMDYGEYGGENDNGGTPTGYNSYERMQCGWLTPTLLEGDMTVMRMQALSTEPQAYLLPNKAHPDEYYLLENRQQEGWDAWLPAHGMLVFHIDYDAQAWADNRINTLRKHPRLTILPADNALTVYSLSGDTWPGKTGNTMLSDSSTPAVTLYNANTDGSLLMHCTISDISEQADGTIAFRFRDEEASGLSTTPGAWQDGESPFYNMAGQRVSSAYHGITVKLGRKLLPASSTQ